MCESGWRLFYRRSGGCVVRLLRYACFMTSRRLFVDPSCPATIELTNTTSSISSGKKKREALFILVVWIVPVAGLAVHIAGGRSQDSRK
jgi:hypothetical protein